MSALGHKRTYAVQTVMSALPPKADMCSALAHVCFVPIADIHVSSVRPLKHFLNVTVRTTGRQLRSRVASGNLRCIGPANAQRIDRTLLD
jgi:hypothetical protein